MGIAEGRVHERPSAAQSRPGTPLHCPNPACNSKIITIVPLTAHGSLRIKCPACQEWVSFVLKYMKGVAVLALAILSSSL
jgi:hypothetical protein